MKFNINKILSEWAYRVDDGQPDKTNSDHIENLREVLYDFGLPYKFINEYVSNLQELEFRSRKGFDRYVAKHKMRPTTKVTIGGKETTAGEVDDKDSDQNKSKVSKSKLEAQERKEAFLQKSIDALVADLTPREKVHKAGQYSFTSQEDAKIFSDFIKESRDYKKANNGNIRPQKLEYPGINDDDIDMVWTALEQRALAMGLKKETFTKIVAGKGAPNKGAQTPGRGKMILKHALQCGMKSAVTGKIIPFSEMQADHAKSLSVGGKDEAGNLWWMEERYNQKKSNFDDDKVIADTKKILNQDPEKFELGLLTHRIKNIEKHGTRRRFTKQFEAGTHAGITEDKIDNMSYDELSSVAVALNKSQGWKEKTAQAIKRGGQKTDDNPDNKHSHGLPLSRKFPPEADPKLAGNRVVKSKKPKNKIYEKLANDPNSLTTKEKLQIEQDRNTWGVVIDDKTKIASEAEFGGKEIEWEGEMVSPTKLVEYQFPSNKNPGIYPIGYIRSKNRTDQMRESGGGKLGIDEMRENVKDGFKRSNLGPAPSVEESNQLNKALGDFQNGISEIKDLKSLIKKEKDPSIRSGLKQELKDRIESLEDN